ncbi:glycoside hydrolase family 63 protein [Myriangium duriaei CBS 260.36]|uniref:Mannosyl-oligosaccharide glucosidase n=1 Tax=Myriangium duriaei CBS 260.36 TaxID=1168546 RepID=A0A9P4MKE2_9PEZI|nr:glycoside hydrolase family 63 protein [Myriangium duriaei CBS 260.36]
MSDLRHWPLAMLCLILALASSSLAAEASVYSKASNDSLLWGAYRPNVYFGVRPRLPKSLITGLMWARVDDFASVQNNFRHTCEQNEGMAGYGWDSYDPRHGGKQTIHDAGNGIDITTEFVKFPDRGSNGGSWGARIKGVPREEAPPNLRSTVVFYAGLEGFGSLSVDNVEGTEEEQGFEGDVKIAGQTNDLGDFHLTVTQGTGRHPQSSHPGAHEDQADHTRVHSMQIPEAGLWQAKSAMFTSIKQVADQYIEKYTQENMPPPFQTFRIANSPGNGNIHIIQKTFEGPFEFDVVYSQGDAGLQAGELGKQIKEVNKSIKSRFAKVHSPAAPFKTPHYEQFSSSLFSNLIGGIGYFHGDQIIDRSYATEYEEENEGFWEETAAARARNEQKLEGPYELFTSIPSRPFFPRGFLWDEGFHLIPIVEWDIELTLQIVKSWFNTMDEEGWIPREQILGPEARSKVPQEFQIQYPHYANPPTLFFILELLLDKSSQAEVANEHPFVASNSQLISYLSDLYPLLKRQYDWFRKTQRGNIKSYDREAFSSREAYRWRGRTQTHLLTSGLDDYPRAPTPHPGELHVDLLAWMGMLTRVMQRLATALDLSDDAADYASTYTAIKRNMADLHWSSQHKAYCDATVDDYEESVHVCHKGYISLFPFMLGLIDYTDDKLGHVLDTIGDTEQLWSPHGIRSLSKSDELYESGENYWRSPVWVNMNYLIVKELLNVARSSSPHAGKAKQLYTDLRKNLVNTVFESWKETGFAWEQYNPETGKGQRTQHFTGWTSLVVSIMGMPDLDSGGVESKEQVPIRDEL